MISIWLDDLRDPNNYNKKDSIWLKNTTDFFLFLISAIDQSMEDLIEEMHFDNDLGEERDGYFCFAYIEEALHKGNYKGLKTIYVHTSNPSAAQKFMSAKDSFKERFGIDIVRNHY